jgi:hypothetical protein
MNSRRFIHHLVGAGEQDGGGGKLFDHMIGAHEDSSGKCDSKLFGGLRVYG